MPLQKRLVEFIEKQDVELNGELKRDTALITSGLFDSMSLFNLAAWIEQEIGKPVDPTTFNLLEEWNTIADIVKFVEKHRSL